MMNSEFGSKEWHFDKIVEELNEYNMAEEKDKPKEYGDLVLAVFRYGEKMGYHIKEHLELSWLKINSRMRIANDMIAINPKLTIKQAYMRAKALERGKDE